MDLTVQVSSIPILEPRLAVFGTGMGTHQSKWVVGKSRTQTKLHCHRCGVFLGAPGTCLECKAYIKAWKKVNPDRVAKIAAAQRLRDKLDGKKRKSRAKIRSPEEIALRLERSSLRKADRRRRKKALRRARGRGRLSWGITGRLFNSQGGKCVYCRESLDGGYHLDHIVPLARGGQNEDHNVQLLCASCNQSKHARDPIEFAKSIGLLV